MKDILHLLADGLVAAGTALSNRTRGFSEREAEKYLLDPPAVFDFDGGPSWQQIAKAGSLCAPCPEAGCVLGDIHMGDHTDGLHHRWPNSSAAAGGEAAASAATHVDYPRVGVGRAPGEHTSELLFAAVNQLGVLLKYSHFNHLRESYLEELIPELRERARELVLQGD